METDLRYGLQKVKVDESDPRHHQTRLKFGTPLPPPLVRLCCANQVASKSRCCPRDGTLSCSGCFLVRYCSKECQLEHWGLHKKDCKNPLKSASWSPAWVQQMRFPSFIGGDVPQPGMEPYLLSQIGMGVILWGNIAAIDVINAKHNEGVGSIRNKDLSIAFVASGDLRNVVKTVNELPEDYSGTIKVVLNDLNTIVVCRNIMILAILGTIPDIEEAAEHALHLWYSVFQPISYQTRILPRILESQTLQNLTGKRAQLTHSTSMHTTFSTNTIAYLMDILRAPALDPDVASNALNDIMNAPQRGDYRDRYYASIKPSHRVAFERWRSSGLILPFGAANAHLAIPNRWLFTKDGRLFLSDDANPFEGWDFDEIFDSGKAHGTTEADLIGSLFFHIMDQLVEFSKRLRRFKIQIYSFDLDATKLPRTLKSNTSFPQSFDRIEVSNIMDKNYVSMSVLSGWGPFLNQANPHATIIGLFMNWYKWKESADFMLSPGDFSSAKERMSACPYTGFSLSTLSPLDPKMIKLMDIMTLFHDTSKVFEEYLKDEKEDVISRKAGLLSRRVNKIVPHRLFAKLGTTKTSLPHVDSADVWYRMASLSGYTYYERYVEWSRATTGQ